MKLIKKAVRNLSPEEARDHLHEMRSIDAAIRSGALVAPDHNEERAYLAHQEGEAAAAIILSNRRLKRARSKPLSLCSPAERAAREATCPDVDDGDYYYSKYCR